MFALNKTVLIVLLFKIINVSITLYLSGYLISRGHVLEGQSDP